MTTAPRDGNIHFSTDGRVATLTIDRQSARNALTLDMWRAIPELVAKAEAQPAVVALVIRGVDDSVFAAGADISELRTSLDDPRAGRDHLDAIGSAEQSIGEARLVTIARISGYCIGGGLEIAMACDRRFASTSTVLATPPTSLGVAYSVNSTRRLIELIGVSKTRDLLFTARRIDGDTAHRWGLVDEVLPVSELDQAVQDFCGQLGTQSPYAIRLAKLAIAEALDRPTETAALKQLRTDSFSGPDLREGIAAFEERRSPRFTSQWLK